MWTARQALQGSRQRLRPSKKRNVLQVTGLKTLGRVGTHFYAPKGTLGGI